MTCLLDTHAFIWAVMETGRLSRSACGIITDRDNDVNVSVVSFWEISLKTGMGKFSFGNVRIEDFPGYAREMGFGIIDIRETEAITFHQLPAKEKHKDPFDRMLIWQAITKNMTLISADKSFSWYAQDGLKLVW